MVEEDGNVNEMNLLADFRAAVAPPEEGALARARGRMLSADARGRRGRHPGQLGHPGRLPKLALTGAVVAAAAVATPVIVSALPGSAPGTLLGRAWAVDRNSDGSITVTVFQQFNDPAGLQRALRKEGVAAYVATLPLTTARSCARHLSRDAEPKAVQDAVISSRPPNMSVAAGVRNGRPLTPTQKGKRAAAPSWTIHPAAMPRGSALFFDDWQYRGITGAVKPVVLRAEPVPQCR